MEDNLIEVILDDLIARGNGFDYQNFATVTNKYLRALSKEYVAWQIEVEDLLKNYYYDNDPIYLRFVEYKKVGGLENLEEHFSRSHEAIVGILIATRKKFSTSKKKIIKSAYTNDVFIVHGHDDTLKAETASFIKELGLNPIILSEQPNGGKTLIEKFEKYSNVGFVVVLYTPCDVGGEDKTNLQGRARQNVVFEHGFFIGKLGRDRVSALDKNPVEQPGDILGLVYISVDDSNKWKGYLVKDLREAGYSINFKESIK